MPGPQAAQNLQMPYPRDWWGGQMPRSSGGGGGRPLGAAGIDWCITFELAWQSCNCSVIAIFCSGKTMVSVVHANLSVAWLALFLVAFTRATLIVLCRGENGKPFCLAELWSCTNMRFFPTPPTLPTFLPHPSPLFYSRHFSPGPLSWSETARKRLLTSWHYQKPAYKLILTIRWQ